MKRPVSGEKKMSFHPTQKAITNMLADLRELGLRPLYGARFDLRTIHLLSEIQVGNVKKPLQSRYTVGIQTPY